MRSYVEALDELHTQSLTAHVRPATTHQPLAANDNLPRVVALTGVAGSGKSTAADYLQRRGYQLVKFAGPLKDMLRAIGLSESQIEGAGKESPSHLLQGKTPRHAMQTLGTEWGRKCLGEDFWIGLWRTRVETILENDGRVVVDDCRFPNEAATIRKLGGDIYRLVGRGGLADGHESERQDFVADCWISNTGAREVLHANLDDALRRYA